MDVNSRDPSQNIIPFRIKGVDVARFDICGNLGIGTTAPTAKLEVAGTVKISGDLFVNGNPLNSLTSGVVINMDSQPAPATALNRQKKQSIPLAASSTLSTSDVIAKMSGVSVGKTQTYGVGPSQMASYGNIVVAVGSGTNSIAYSLANPPTASSWVGIPNSANTFTIQGRNIAYANGTWVAAGEGTNAIAYSTMTPPVASSWVGIPTAASFNGVVNTFGTTARDIAYGNGAWVAVGSGTNSIAYSLANPPTAESWVGIIINSSTNFGTEAYGITFGNGTWVATGLGTNGIAYSTRTPPTSDSWNTISLANTNDAGVSNVVATTGLNVIYANGVWLAAGNGTNVLCYSVENPPIASSWMPITTSVLFGTFGRSLAYGNGTWVACGESGTLLAYSTSRIPHSSSWVSMKGPTPSSSGEQINHVGFNAATNTWYFMGDIGTNCMFYSTATPPVPASWVGVQRSAGAFTTQAFGAVGITTNAFTSPINVARLDNKVTFPANRMIAVGGGGSSADVLARSSNTPAHGMTGTISYSDDDGATWAMVPGGATNAMFSSAADIAAGTSFGVGGSLGANAVAWNGEKWVAAGNGRTNSLAFSDDGGMSWTGITGKSIFSVEARDIAWNGQMWVAVGRGVAFSTAYSYDGVTWMGAITNDTSGTPINVFSYDIAGPTAATSDISGGGNHVIWTGKMWVATGTRTLIAGSSPAAYYTIAYSTDGKTWTGMPESGATSTGFDMYAYDVAWNGRNYIATGRGTVNTMAHFTDVSGVALTAPSWLGLGNTVFSIWGRGITWGARRWMATGRGTNTIAYSTNGRNWQGCGANVFKPMRRFMAMGDTGVYSGQRGVAFSYSDDGVTWDAPVVNQSLEFSTPLGTGSDSTRSVIYTSQMLLTNVITDNVSQHTALMYSTDGGASWARVPGSSDTEANGGTGMTTANNGSYSLATNPTRTRFLVGGGDTASATKKVYFSNDGFNWRNSISSPNITQMAWVSASLWVGGSYNRWLIGGSDATSNANGRIMYSGDADATAAWVPASPATYINTPISCFAANTDFSIILAGTQTIANTIYRSINGGATWTPVSISGTSIGNVRSIAFSPSLGRWVAVGGAGATNVIIYSTDGTTWNVPPQGVRGGATGLFKDSSEITRVIWDAVGRRFIVGGGYASSIAVLTNVSGLEATSNNNPGYTMAYSADGINWTPVTVRSSDDAGTGIGASTFGPFLTRCREIMALDTAGDFTPINTGYSVTWNSYANRFVATGNGTTPVVYSNDGGVTWTPANQQPQQQAIAVAGGLGAAAGTAAVSHITYTIDGKTWSQGIGIKEIFGTGSVFAIKYGQTSTAVSPNGRIWVAGGTPTSGTSCLAFSQNGIRWTAISSASTMITNVRAITYAPAEQMSLSINAATTAGSGVGNGVWVAGGDTTNSLIFSYDGISWSEVPNSLTILSRCNACAFGNGLFVAGGVAATGASAIDTTANLVYSTDGFNWKPIRGSSARISAGASIGCITYGRDENGRGLWVAGATGSTVISLLYSYNGIDWIGVSDSGTTISSLAVTGVAYGVSTTTGRGLWVATVHRSTADGNAFVFSTNGRDGWTAVPNTKDQLFNATNSGPNGIAYMNGVWYATGTSAGISAGRTLAYSYEGSSGWFGVYPISNMYGTALTSFSLTDMRCIATTNDYMIPCGASAGVATSSGTAAASFRPSSLAPVRNIGWTAGVGFAYLQHPTLLFGADSGRAGTVAGAISADGGRTWGGSTVSLAQSAFRGGVCNDAFWNGTTWGAVGYDAATGAKVARSKDGVTWTQSNVPITGVLNSIMWNGSVWMVGGDGSPTNDTNTTSIAWSSDLVAWNGIANTDISLTVVKRIAWNGMYWVAVGQGAGGAATIMYSKNRNGMVWEDTFTSASSTAKTSTITTAVNDVVWGGGRWVAVGRGNSVAGGAGVSILYSVDTPVVGSEPAEYAITGRRWTGVTSSAQLFPYGASSVSWNGKRFVATGPAAASYSTSNIIAWSADGISWNAYSSAKTVAPGQRWVAVGSGSRACIALSADGRVWTDVSGSALLFSDISGASTALVSTMKTGARAVGWNGNSLVVGGARSATKVTAVSQLTATATTGRTTIPVCAFIGSGNGVLGGGTTNSADAATHSAYTRVSSSVFITHMDVNIREASAPYANMWLNTYTDLSATQLFQVTPEMQTFSSALKWNGWSWVANFGMTTNNTTIPTGEQYGSIWYCTDPLARVGWSVASNSATPRILMGQGGYAALEWNGVAWLACGYDPSNNNLIYTTDKYGAVGWTAVSGIVSGGSASFQPVCIASSSRFWVVGGSSGTTSALYYTSDRTGATGWCAITTGGGSVLPGIRISSVGYNGSAWICCGGGGGGSGSPASSISWRADTGSEEIRTGWAVATISGSSGGIPPVLANGSAVMYNGGSTSTSPSWVVVGDVTSNTSNQIAYTTTVNGATEWKIPTGTLSNTLFGRLNGLAWTGYSWIATSGAGAARIMSTTDITAATSWNSSPTNSIYTPTLCTNAIAYANIPISLLTTGMSTSAGVGAGTGAMWRAGVGRAQGLLPGGGSETTSVVARSSNGAEGTTWSQVYSRNFLIAVGGGVIRDAAGGGGTNRMAYSYDGGLSWTTNTTVGAVLTTAAVSIVGSIRTVKYGNGIWVAGGDSAGSGVSGNNCLAWSRDGVNWTGAGGTQIFGSAGACYAVCCNDRGRWVAVGGAALTTSGTYTNTSGAIYTMAWSDDGMNWTPIIGSRGLFGIVCQGVSYGADASGVGMWTAIGRGSAYTGLAYSYDAKNWFLSQTSAFLFGTSSNVLTERYAPVAGADWRTVAMNSTGQYQFADAGAGLVYRSVDYGVTWVATTLPSRNWVSVAVSSTGQYVMTASSDGATDRLYNSSDFGVTWVGRGYASNAWVQVAISASGQYQVGAATSLAIQISRDYGVTWSATDSSRSWSCIAISSSGQYITAPVASVNIFKSSDYGVSFTTQSNASTWSCVAMSSTGQIQLAGLSTTASVMYVSTDYGVNWANTGSSPSAIYRSLAISSTGQYRVGVTATGTTDTIKRSNNYDSGWTAVGASTNYFAIAMSATGQYQTAVSQTSGGTIYISSNFGETWSSGANDSRSLSVVYGKDASGAGMWVATAGRRDRDIAASAANTMAYSYDGKLWRGIAASVGLSEQAWTVAYGKDGFGVGMWVAAGYDTRCGLKWSYDGVTWNASMGASGAAIWTSMAAGRRALTVYWNGSMWLASTSDTRNGSPSGTGIAANNASSVTGYLLYSYNGKNWLPVLAPNTYNATISASAQPSVYSVLPNPAILDFGSFYDDQAQRGVTIANTTARTVGAVMSGVPVENVNTIVPYGRGSLTTGQVPFLMGGDSGLVDLTPFGPISAAAAAAAAAAAGPLYTFTSHTFTNADQTGREGPELATVRSVYTAAGATWATTYINMTTRGIQEWTVPATGSYTIRAVGAAGGNPGTYGRGRDIQLTTTLTKGEVIKILVGQQGRAGAVGIQGAGGGGTFVVTGTQPPIIVAGGGGGRGTTVAYQYINSNANNQTSGNKGGDGSGTNNGEGGAGGGGGNAAFAYAAGGGGLLSGGSGLANVGAGVPFIIGGLGGSGGIYAGVGGNEGGFGGGGAANSEGGGGGGGGYSGGGGGYNPLWASGGGGGSFPSTATDAGAINTGDGLVTITANFTITAITPTPTLITISTLPITSDLASTTASLSTSVDGGITWRAVPNSTRVMTKVNKILCDETTQQIVAVGAGNYSVATSTPARAADADGWVGVFGSRMTDTRAGLFEKYGTGASWFGGAKMWIASGRAQSRRGSSLAVSVNGTVWQDAKIVSQTTAGAAGAARGGGLTSRTTTGVTMTSSVIPYTSASTPLTTYTDSAAAFSTQVGSVATNSQYNRAVVGGSGVQFVAGGRGGSGLAYSNDGQNWTAAASGTSTVFQTPTNVAAYSTATGSGGFDASFGTMPLTQKMSPSVTYPSGAWYGVSVSATGQYQSMVVSAGNIWTSSDYGVTWTVRSTGGNTYAWTGISVNSTGQYQLASGVSGGELWSSSDYGVTWTQRATGRNYYVGDRSISSTGQYQSAMASQIWVSSDYGMTWLPKAGSLDWKSVSLSSTGQYQSAVVNAGNIWASSDFGVSWTERTTGSTRNWRSVALSSTGKYQTAVIGSGNGNIWTSSDFGVTWAERTTGSTRFWISVSLSSTGQYQTAVVSGGYIWISADYGATWNPVTAPGSLSWYSVSISSTGQYQTAVVNGGSIYTSTNFGVTWVQRSTATKTNAFTRIKSSASGQYQLATSGPVGNANGQFYVSSDYGQTWIPRRGLGSWLGGTVSATGAVMMAMTTPTAATAAILRSTDYGNTFSDIAGTALTGTAYWRAIAATNSVATQTAVAYGGAIYRSVDSGATWTNTGITIDGNASANTTTPRNWQDIAVSAETGTYQLACVKDGYIYYSSDYGVTWTSASVTIESVTPQAINRSWKALANSANGKYGLACVNSATDYGYIYRSENFGAAWSAYNLAIAGVGSQVTSRLWQDVGMSANGKYQVACLNENTNSSTTPSTTSTFVSTVSVMVPPPGALATTYGTSWSKRGGDIDGEAVGDQSGYSVSMSADGTVVAVGAPMNNDANGQESGQVRVYALTGGGVWAPRGADIDGEFGLTTMTTAMVVTATTTSGNTVGTRFGISLSSTGQYQTLTDIGDQISISSNYGVTWTKKESVRSWRQVSLSSTGQYQSTTVSFGQIYISSDFGNTWTSKESIRNWTGISISSNGRYQTAVAIAGYIYISSDFGFTWTPRLTDSTRNWYQVSLSSTGQYQTAVAGDSPNYPIYVSSDYGNTWTSKESSRSWYFVSVSSSGQYQTAVPIQGNIYGSSDFGNTWNPKGSAIGWYRISISSTGQYQTAVTNSGSIYTSSDFGNNWTNTGLSGYNNISISSTGQYQTATTAALAYFSRDYGFTWSPYASYDRVTGDQSGYSVNMSANGNTVAIGAPYYDGSSILNRGQVRVYDWSGSAWSPRGLNIMYGEGTNDYSGMSVSLSKDGNVVAIGAPFNDGANGTDSGQVRVYAWSGSAWAQRGVDIDGEYGLTTTTNSRVVTATATSATASWYSISLSSTGQYQSAVARTPNGYIYTSSDYGVTWTARTAPGSLSWIFISLSSTGQYQSAVVDTSGYIWVSSDYGITWASVTAPGSLNWRSISVSSTGQYQSAAGQNSYIWRSIDYGVTWASVTAPGTLGWNSISISSTGQYQSAVAGSGYIWRSDDYGATWASVTAPGTASWQSISLSSTGQYQSAVIISGYIWRSIDYGATWATASVGTTTWVSISLSSTGQYQSAIAQNNYIYTSSDYGLTLSSVTAPGAPTWTSITVSSTGQYQSAVVQNGLIYFSRDYGLTWSTYASYEITTPAVVTVVTAPTTIVSAALPSISLSSTGQYQSAAVAGTGNILTSSNYGVTWTSRAFSLNWTSISLSSTGKYQSAVAQYNYIWVSSDYGITWAQPTGLGATQNWKSISVSSTGQYQSAVIISGYIWRSIDYGATWASVTAPGTPSWFSISVSSTGQYQSAVIYGGNIWRSIDYGATWASVTAPGTGNWRSISLSSTGQYQTVVMQSSYIWRSIDYGVTWTSVTAPGNPQWYYISVSSTGQYQTVVVASGYIWRSTDYGVTWASIVNPTTSDSRTISLSSTGQYQTAGVSSGSIIFSRDYGLTWSTYASYEVSPTVVVAATTSAAATWKGVSLSMSGQYQTAVIYNGLIYTSSDYGVTWTPQTTLGIKNWRTISISSSGQYQTAGVDPGFIWRSDNYGATWTSRATNLTSLNWWCVSVSSTGKYQSAVAQDYWIYRSDDYGATWNRATFQHHVTTMYGISVSSSGKYQTAVVWNGLIYTSSDYGVSWAQPTGPTTGNQNWYSISVSSTGQYQSAGCIGFIHRSINYGATWASVTESGNRNWYSISVSSTGQYQSAVVLGGNIWRSIDYGATWTYVTETGILYWVSISVSSTGQYQTAMDNNGGLIYFSRDYGFTWSTLASYDVNPLVVTATTASPILAWYSTSISSTGQYQSAAANGGNIWRSIDYGATWASVANSTAWLAISVSSTGKYQSAAPNVGYIWRSEDFGASWTEVIASTHKNWYSISVSSTGKYQSAVVRIDGNIYTSDDFGVTWTPRLGPGGQNWYSISVSSTGQYQSAAPYGGYIWRSDTYGTTWTSPTAASGQYWVSISLSSTGQYQSAVAYGGYIWRSDDYGATWASVTAPGTASWQSISLSSTGQYQSAVINGIIGNIYFSSDYGVTWTPITVLGGLDWRSISVSSTGQYQRAVANGEYIYFSRDYGFTWSTLASYYKDPPTVVTATTMSASTNVVRQWYSVSLSSTGQYQSAAIDMDYIYTSSDYGVTWTPRTAPGPLRWMCISLSSTGQYQTAGIGTGTGGYIRTSSDYGATWASVTAPGNNYWSSVSLSSTGKYQSAVASGGFIWRSIDYGATWNSTNAANPGSWASVSL